MDAIEHVSTKQQHPQVSNAQALIDDTNHHALEVFHVSTKQQYCQVLNVQALINDTNHHALKVFHVSNINVDFVDVREVDVKPNETSSAFGHPFYNHY